MWYVIFSQDVENSLEKRLSVRPQHLERLQQLHDEGRLLTAGPMPAIDSDNPGEAGFTGSDRNRRVRIFGRCASLG